MTGTTPRITASFTFHGTEFKDIDVVNPGDCFGKTWLLGISCGFDTDYYIVEADSATDAIDELIDSGKGDALKIDECAMDDYMEDPENPTYYSAGNNGIPCDLDWLSIHGDERTGFPCLYNVEGWAEPVKPTELSTALEHLEMRAHYEEQVKGHGKFEGEPDDDGPDGDNEPDEDDITTTDHRTFYQYGKPVLTVGENEDHVKAIRAFMDREQFWPNVWFISDHGNAHLMDLSDNGPDSPNDSDPDGLDEFTNAYIGCALWSSTDNADDSGGEPLDANHDEDDLSPETLATMRADCRDFLTSFGSFVADDYARAGHDFWLTRNRHGAGFWDGDWDAPYVKPTDDAEDFHPAAGQYATVGDYLTAMSKPYGEFDLYIGDDGKIHDQ